MRVETKVVLSVILSATILCSIPLPTQAASIHIKGTVVASEKLPGFDFIFTNLDDGHYKATAIEGFQSLDNVDPSTRVTGKFGGYELSQLIFAPTTVTEVYSDLDQETDPGYYDMFLDGELIGTATDFEAVVVTQLTTIPPVATAHGSFRLIGPADSEFYQEVLLMTGGTGVFDYTLDEFIPLGTSDPTTFVYTGVMIPTPLPGAFWAFGSALGLISWKRRQEIQVRNQELALSRRLLDKISKKLCAHRNLLYNRRGRRAAQRLQPIPA